MVRRKRQRQEQYAELPCEQTVDRRLTEILSNKELKIRLKCKQQAKQIGK